MKNLGFFLLASATLCSLESSSHAFIQYCTSYYSSGRANADFEYCWNREGTNFWLTSTTLTGPIALIADGNLDFSNPEARNLVLAQADTILAGASDAIQPTQNLVRILAQTYGVDEKKMAEALQLLGEKNKEITRETITELLK